MAILPLLLILLTLGFTVSLCYRYKMRRKLSLSISSIIIILFLIHPNVVSSMFEVYDCDKIDNDPFVRENLSLKCWSVNHIIYSFGIAMPALIIWGFGIPAFAVVMLIKHKDQMDKETVRKRYGFLYNGYKQKFFYWESVIMIRKILFIGVKVLGQSYGTITQA